MPRSQDSVPDNSEETKTTKDKISKFISHVSDKNYAEAHKYLSSAVEDKLLKRIDNATDKPLF